MRRVVTHCPSDIKDGADVTALEVPIRRKEDQEDSDGRHDRVQRVRRVDRVGVGDEGHDGKMEWE